MIVSYFKKFFVILFCFTFFSAQYNISISAPVKKTTTKKTTKNKIKKLNPTKTSKIKTQSNTPTTSSHKQTKQSNSVVLSGYIIDPDSELCVFAAKNDVLRLKKAMSDKKYERYVDQLCKNNESLLLIAVKNDNYLVVKYLLEKGADVNIPNIAGVTPLHMVCRSTKPNADKIFHLLIKVATLNKNEKDLTGYTPLMRAVEFEKVDFVEKLVELGADVNVKNDYDEDALSLAEKRKLVKKNENDIKVSDKIINILKK